MKSCVVTDATVLVPIRRLTEAKEFTNLTAVCAIDNSYVVEVTLLLLSLLSQNVTVVSVMSFNLTSTSESKSFFSTGICLNFWHCFIVL